MDVICIGNLNFDISFHISQIPDVHQKVRCEDATFSCGGSAGNTACWLSSLGVTTGVVGAVGDDVFGCAQIDDLSRYHVDTSHVKKISLSGIAVILVEGEAKRMIKFTGANQYKEIDEFILEADHIHLSSNEKDTVKRVIDICRGRDISLSWDPQELFYEEFLPFFDYVFMNEDDLRRESGIEDMKRAAEIFRPAVLVVTKNGGGCFIFADTAIDVPSLGLNPVDSTGAGDAFDAGFISGLQKKFELRECGILGTACASISVQHYGARGGISDIQGVRTFLQQHNVYIRKD
jgi:sugar/nucleoside kinase (ribokinase family)